MEEAGVKLDRSRDLTSFSSVLHHIFSPSRWGIGIGLATLLIFLPILAVLLYLTQGGPQWAHIVETVLFRYLLNTLVLVVGVTITALLMGVLPAWLVTVCEFPGRWLLSWLLILPLALPSYVAAFVFYQLPEAAIPFLIWVRTNYSIEAFLRWELVIRYGILIIMMGAVLYPYVYLACRAAFSQQGRALIESARCLGDSPAKVFFRVALPMARPAMVAGSALVIMEVINDYGAVNFFGVPTLTEGIFRTWFGMDDKVSALRLAGIVMLAVGILLGAEHILRGRAKYAEGDGNVQPMLRRKLSRGMVLLALLVCLVPLSIGFLYPVTRLIHWAWLNLTSELATSLEFGEPLFRGLILAGSTALFVTLAAALFAFGVRLRGNPFRQTCFRIAGLGYATPGAVIAVGVLVVLGNLDRIDLPLVPVLSGSVIGIGFAYLIRFFAIPLHLSHAGMERLGPSLGEASRTLGRTPLASFWRVDLPLLAGPLLAAAMLLFVDILKELPLTLILRPVNFETLATTAFSLAKESRLQACAVPSLMIVAASAVGLLIMNLWLTVSKSNE